jgi:hypothetical protein
MFVERVSPPESEPVALQAMIDYLRLGRTEGDNPSDDNLILSLISAARETAEVHTGKSICKKDYLQVHDGFREWHRDGAHAASYIGNRASTSIFHHPQSIKLFYPPLNYVAKIEYVDPGGVLQTLQPGVAFQVDPVSQPGRVAPLPGEAWPLTMLHAKNAVQIFFNAGFEVESSEEPAGDPNVASAPEPEVLDVSDSPVVDQVPSYLLNRTCPSRMLLAIKQLVVHWYQNRDPVIAQAGGGGKFNALPFHVEALLDSERCIDYAPSWG